MITGIKDVVVLGSSALLGDSSVKNCFDTPLKADTSSGGGFDRCQMTQDKQSYRPLFADFCLLFAEIQNP